MWSVVYEKAWLANFSSFCYFYDIWSNIISSYFSNPLAFIWTPSQQGNPWHDVPTVIGTDQNYLKYYRMMMEWWIIDARLTDIWNQLTDSVYSEWGIVWWLNISNMATLQEKKKHVSLMCSNVKLELQFINSVQTNRNNPKSYNMTATICIN